MINEETFYSPTLRLKEGEVVASANVTRDAKPYMAPIYVAAPPDDHDPEKGRPLTDAELVSENGFRVARAWGNLPCMLDVRFLLKRFGADAADSWLPSVFGAARDAGAKPGVVVNLADAAGPMLRAYRLALARVESFVAVRITLADLQMPELEARLSAVMGALDVVPQDAVAVLDFGGADVSSIEVASDVFVAAYERLMSYQLWRRVIITGTSYPESNPAKEGELVLVPRTEHAIWQRLINSGSVDRPSLIVGDFGPDSSKFEFKSSPFAPIPHYRYSTAGVWLVVRGTKVASHKGNVLAISRRLVGHDLYMGHDYSFGDRYYYDSSRGDVVGAAKEWRAANVNHHLQFVVRHVGVEFGVRIEGLPARAQQMRLFADPVS